MKPNPDAHRIAPDLQELKAKFKKSPVSGDKQKGVKKEDSQDSQEGWDFDDDGMDVEADRGEDGSQESVDKQTTKKAATRKLTVKTEPKLKVFVEF